MSEKTKETIKTVSIMVGIVVAAIGIYDWWSRPSIELTMNLQHFRHHQVAQQKALLGDYGAVLLSGSRTGEFLSGSDLPNNLEESVVESHRRAIRNTTMTIADELNKLTFDKSWDIRGTWVATVTNSGSKPAVDVEAFFPNGVLAQIERDNAPSEYREIVGSVKLDTIDAGESVSLVVWASHESAYGGGTRIRHADGTGTTSLQRPVGPYAYTWVQVGGLLLYLAAPLVGGGLTFLALAGFSKLKGSPEEDVTPSPPMRPDNTEA